MNEELLNRNRNINCGYRKLEVWKEAIELYVFVKNNIRTLKSVPFKIKAKIEDSILSYPSNIAEGYSRKSLKEYIHYVNIALASLSENYTQIFALLSSGDIDREWYDEYDRKHYSLENKLVKMNKTMLTKIDQNEWKSDYILRELMEKYKA